MQRIMWSDERIDDRFAQSDRNMDLFREEMREFHTEMRDFRTEIREFRAEMHGELTGLRTEMHGGFASLRREMLYAALAMSSVLVATMATILAKTL